MARVGEKPARVPAAPCAREARGPGHPTKQPALETTSVRKSYGCSICCCCLTAEFPFFPRKFSYSIITHATRAIKPACVLCSTSWLPATRRDPSDEIDTERIAAAPESPPCLGTKEDSGRSLALPSRAGARGARVKGQGSRRRRREG